MAKSLILKFETTGDNQNYEIVYDGKSKTELVRFKYEELIGKQQDLLSSKSLKELSEEYDRGRTGINGFDYLGFRYDGSSIYLRDSTYSNLRRKIKTRCRIVVRKFVRERPTLSKSQLTALFVMEKKRLQEAFGKVRNFESGHVNPQQWTFTTYSKKISDILDPKLNKVRRQLRGLTRIIDSEADSAFADVLKNTI